MATRPNSTESILLYESQDGTIRLDVRMDDGPYGSRLTRWLLSSGSHEPLSTIMSLMYTPMESYQKCRQRGKSKISIFLLSPRTSTILMSSSPSAIGRSPSRARGSVSGQTVAELVYYRANASLPMMGLTTTKVSGEVRQADVTTGKNYLTEEELQALKLIVEQYLAFAEAQARA